jgi:FtsZ-binding cell division protein ZapB
MTTYELITTFVGPVCGLIGWLAGRRIRRNETIKALQTTIDMLVEKNKELYDEIMRLRKENDNLRDDAVKRDNKIASLELQIEQLKK